MVKAVVSQGAIRPLEPLPADWQDGQPLRVEAEEIEASTEVIDRDFALLAALCEGGDPTDEDKLEQALLESRRQAKEQVRRRMGLA